jgi:PAS domain S-box-containing protein
MASKTVLCVADEESILHSRKQVLQSSGFSVLTASSSDALTAFASQSVDAVVLDCSMPDIESGRGPVPLKHLSPRTPVILMSSNPSVAEKASTRVDVFISGEHDASLLLSRLRSLIALRGHSHAELEHEYVIFADASRRYLDCSDGVCRLLGYTRMELIGKTIDDVSYIPERVPELFAKFIKQGEQSGEYMLQHKTGRPVLIRYRSYIFSDGCIAAVWEPVEGWKELYNFALVEVDPVKLEERVRSTRTAIEARIDELKDQRTSEEWRALHDALTGLAILSREFTK